VSKRKNVGGRPKHTAEHHSGPAAAQNFHNHMRAIIAVPKKHVLSRKATK